MKCFQKKREKKREKKKKSCHRRKLSLASTYGDMSTKRTLEGIEEGIWCGGHMILLCA